MPPQDSQTLARTGSSDRQITCETLANDVAEHPDIPPESFWLSKDAELDWFDRNAFLERKDSTKTHNHNNGSSGCNSNPPSQRFAVTKKSKTSIIGLPKPQQKPCLVEARHRRNQTNSRLFPKRGSGKAEATMAEPSSPKVSCMGRVRSRRDRNRRLKNRQRSLKSSSAAAEKPIERRKKKKKCLWKNLRSIFGSRSGHKPAPEPESQTTNPTRTASRSHVPSRDVSSVVSPPGLGAMARFSSGRRSDGWVGDAAEIRCRGVNGSSLQKRREAGPLNEVNCGRDWGSVGPASV